MDLKKGKTVAVKLWREPSQAFFHRSIQRHHLYKCEELGICEIIHTQSQLCQRCRHRKCLDVGMSVHAIRTGRYTKVKRFKDQAEILKLNKQAGNVEESMANPGKAGSTYKNDEEREKVQDFGGRPSLIDSISSTYYRIPVTQSSTSNPGRSKKFFSETVPSVHEQVFLRNPDSEIASGDNSNKFCPQRKQTKCARLDPCHRELICSELQDCPSEDLEGEITDVGNRDRLGHGNDAQSQHPPCLSGPPVRVDNHLVFDFRKDALDSSARLVTPLDLQDNFQDGITYKTAWRESNQIVTMFGPKETSCFLPFLTLSDQSETPDRSHESHDIPNLPGPSPNAYPTSASSTVVHCTKSGPKTTIESIGLVLRTDMMSISNDFPLTGATHATHAGSKCLLRKEDSFDIDEDSCKNLCNMCVDQLYEDRNGVIAALEKARHDCLDPIFGNIPKEKQEEVFNEHLETCRVKYNTFGSLRRISDHEYEHIRACTGIDMDNRHRDFNVTLKSLEAHVRCIVKFANHIPGFRHIPISDKVKLIKQSRSEMMFAGVYQCVDSERMIGKCCDNSIHCSICIPMEFNEEKAVKEIAEEVETHFSLAGELQKLELTPAEDALFHAIILMTPDRPVKLQDPAVARIHSYLLDILWDLMRRNPSVSSSMAVAQRYSRAKELLRECRRHADQAVAIFKILSISRYSNLSDNPFLHEVLNEYL